MKKVPRAFPHKALVYPVLQELAAAIVDRDKVFLEGRITRDSLLEISWASGVVDQDPGDWAERLIGLTRRGEDVAKVQDIDLRMTENVPGKI